MSEQIHVIIAGDQSRPHSFQLSKKSIFTTLTLTSIVVAVLAAGTSFTAGFFFYNKALVKKVATIKTQMQETLALNDTYEDKISNIIAQKDKELEDLKIKRDLLISQMEVESGRVISNLEKKNILQEASFKQEIDQLLSTAVSELNQRSVFIESVINDIGIKVKKTKGKETQKNSGGPYIAAEDTTYDKLLYRTDSYLKTIQTLPLGRPTDGRVSSRFGKRKDPINGKSSHHFGVDLRGKKGDPIIATADGKVVFAGRNGGFGKFIKIDHGNGFLTSFGHLHNYHVKKGDYITRGQVIGLVGNSGRSTGAHLHYEISHRGKPVNPSKYMKVANLTCAFNTSTEK